MNIGQRVLVVEGDYAGELATVTPNEEGFYYDDSYEDEAVWLHFDRAGQDKGYAILSDQWVPVSEVKPVRTLDYRVASSILEERGYHLVYRKDDLYAMQKIDPSVSASKRKAPEQVKAEAVFLGRRNPEKYTDVDLIDGFEEMFSK